MKKKKISLIFLLLLIINITYIFALEGDDTMLASHPETTSHKASTLLRDNLLLPSHSLTTKPTTNPWNETVIISDTWQQLIGTFFGLNLKKVSTEISVRESIVFFSIFIMFLVIIFDILKLTPFFKANLGIVSGEFLASLIITTLVSISGSLINLKDLFLNIIAHTISSLNWGWVNNANIQTTFSSILTGIIVIIFFTVIILFFNWASPFLEGYSKVSRGEAKGRLLNSTLEK